MVTIRYTLFGLLFAVLTYFALKRISLDPNTLSSLPQSLPGVQALRTYEKLFNTRNDLMLVMESKGDDALLLEDAAKALHLSLLGKPGFVKRADFQPPWMEKPEEAGELLAYAWLHAKPAEIEALKTRLSPEKSAQEFEDAIETLTETVDEKEIALLTTDPLGLTDFSGRSVLDMNTGSLAFVSPDQLMRILIIQPETVHPGYKKNLAWAESVLQHAKDWQAKNADYQDIRIRMTGQAFYYGELYKNMERDMFLSLTLTSVLIVILFRVIYRRIFPLLGMLFCLLATVLLTMLLGSFLYENLTVISVGYGAILIGLVADYGYLIYEESRAKGNPTRKQLFQHLLPSILWAALTTSLVFLSLNLSIMPGASQLGTMVAIGILVGAVFMLYAYLSFVTSHPAKKTASSGRNLLARLPDFSLKKPLYLTVALCIVAVAILTIKRPELMSSIEVMRNADAQAWTTLTEAKERLGNEQNTFRFIVEGETEQEVLERLQRAEEILAKWKEKLPGLDYVVPTGLWPQPAKEKEILTLLETFPADIERLEAEAEEAGFEKTSLSLARNVFAAWKQFATEDEPWPKNEISQWVLQKVLLRTPDHSIALGFVHMPEGHVDPNLELEADMQKIGVYFAGWEHLNPIILGLMKQDLFRVVLPVAGVLLVTLFIVFRNIRGVLLSVLTLLFSMLVLNAVLALIGQEWNLINIASIPLLLGAGLDYSIHMQLALRRLEGKHLEVQKTTGHALLLCGLSSAVGFGSLMLSENRGFSSLGKVCAIGILITMFTAIFLLPYWRQFLYRKEQGS